VVQEFRLRTSRRAECDAARVSEEALLTSEEREAREVGGWLAPPASVHMAWPDTAAIKL